jgi:hypothetical protein
MFRMTISLSPSFLSRKESSFNLASAETKLLVTMHWIMLEAPDECVVETAEKQGVMETGPFAYLFPLSAITVNKYSSNKRDGLGTDVKTPSMFLCLAKVTYVTNDYFCRPSCNPVLEEERESPQICLFSSFSSSLAREQATVDSGSPPGQT